MAHSHPESSAISFASLIALSVCCLAVLVTEPTSGYLSVSMALMCGSGRLVWSRFSRTAFARLPVSSIATGVAGAV